MLEKKKEIENRIKGNYKKYFYMVREQMGG